MNFIKDGVYNFDTIYENCTYRVDDTDCVCNNGYICGHKDCSESCENDDSLGKCYSFSCPLIADTASRETILLGIGDYDKDDIENIDFDDEDFSRDYMKLVVWIDEETK